MTIQPQYQQTKVLTEQQYGADATMTSLKLAELVEVVMIALSEPLNG